jgi:hypothetical protein
MKVCTLTDFSAGRSVLWRLMDGIGLEHCRLTSSREEHVLSGIVITTAGDTPVTIDYLVRCDRFWHTREANILVTGSDPIRSVSELHLRSDGDGSWWRIADNDTGGTDESLPTIGGCVDVDLAFTPATNTLPIRRHELVEGAKIQVSAAWVQFPSLEIAVLNQNYYRIGPQRYRYESPENDFVAILDVDEHGLVQKYEGLWERVAEESL